MAFLLTLPACDGWQAAKLTPLPETAVVLAYGDSLTVGRGTTPDQSYPEVLSRLLGRPIVRSGISGEVTANGVQRLPSVLRQHRPALVILCHGGNDILRGVPESDIEANLRAMVEQARAVGAEVVLVGVPKWGLFAAADAPLYERVADEFDLPYLDGTIADILKDSRLKSDTVHPNAAGYRKLAEDIAELLRNAGAV